MGSTHANHAALPAQVVPFVGRRDDLERLLTLLLQPDNRLVTILGPGGIGKTRLAQELAIPLQEKFQQGVSFVSLVGVDSSAELIPAMAAALKVQAALGEDLRQAVLDKLSSQQTLLVLDNFEHLTPQSLLIHDILTAASQVKVLVTSREKLNLQGEILYHLDGLQLPPGTETIEKYDAVRLFLQRARQARPGFELQNQDVPAVLEICQVVQGMPLGLILAAAWAEHFSAQEIATQIERSLDFLSRDFRDLPERHRSMHAVFDSSFERLDERQRCVLCRLAVFQAGFTFEAAQAVAGADLATLLSLVEKSLLQRNVANGRFELHELLRQYAEKKLATGGESECVNELHSAHYLGFLYRSGPQLKSASQTIILEAIQNDWENIVQAWRWAVEHKDLSTIEPAIPSLYAFCDMRSRYHDGKVLFGLAKQALALSNGNIPCPTWALLLLSWYDMIPYAERPAGYEWLTDQAQACLAQARQREDTAEIADSLVLLGAIAADQTEHETAIGYYQEGMNLRASLDDFYWVSLRIGISQQFIGRYEDSLVSFRIGLARAQALGERVKTGWALFNMGQTFFLQGKNVQAENHFRQALNLFEEIGTLIGVMWAKYTLARIALTDGKQDIAKQLANEASAIADQVPSHLWIGQLNDLLEQISLKEAALEARPTDALSKPLSNRELGILQLLKSDLDGPEIAQKLSISLNTLRFHTKNIYRKLQVNSRREAVRAAENSDR